MNELDYCINEAANVECFEFKRFESNTKILTIFKEFIKSYIHLKKDDREVINSLLSDRFRSRMIGIASLCAEEALFTKDASWLKLGMFCYILTNEDDYREDTRNFALLAFAYHELKANISETINELKDFCTQGVIKKLNNYLNQFSEPFELGWWEMEIIEKDGRPVFKYKPKKFK